MPHLPTQHSITNTFSDAEMVWDQFRSAGQRVSISHALFSRMATSAPKRYIEVRKLTEGREDSRISSYLQGIEQWPN